MLRISARPETVTSLTEISIDEVYLSPDLTFMSATTDVSYGIRSGDRLIINTSNGMTQECIVEAWNVKRQGYVDCVEKLSVEKYVNRNPNNPDKDGKEVEYVEYNGTISYKSKLGAYMIDGRMVKSSSDPVEYSTRKWIENGKVVLMGEEYDVDLDKAYEVLKKKDDETYKDWQGGSTSVYTDEDYSGRVDSAILLPMDEWYEVTKIFLRRNPDRIFGVETAACGKYFPYIEYAGNTYELQRFHGDPNNACDDDTTHMCSDPVDGYGVIIDCKFYNCETLYVEEGGVGYYREPDTEDYVTIKDIDIPINKRIGTVQNGSMCVLFTENEIDFKPNDIIGVRPASDINERLYVHSQTNSLDNPYVVVNGRRCPIAECLFDTIDVEGTTYRLENTGGTVPSVGDILVAYDNTPEENYFYVKVTKTSAHTTSVDGTSVTRDYPSEVVRCDTDGTVMNRMTLGSSGVVEYKQHKTSDAYKITHADGVLLNDEWHEIPDGFWKKEGNLEYESITHDDYGTYYRSQFGIDVTFSPEYTLSYLETEGSSMVVCEPFIGHNEISEGEIIEEKERICESVSANYAAYIFSIKNRCFGDKEITPSIASNEAVGSERPINSSYWFDASKDITVSMINASMKLRVPMAQEVATNLMQEDMLQNGWAEDVKAAAVNRIIDMERDVYFPVQAKWGTNDTIELDKLGREIFDEIHEIEFNLHFRTRRPESWKVIEQENEATDEMANWFVTDYEPYKTIWQNGTTQKKKELLGASDLMGVLGFTNDDIFYQKTKVGQSFIRLSFFDSVNPATQSLMAMSTIFVDEGKLFKTYINNIKNGQFLTVSPSNEDIKPEFSSHTIDVMYEYVKNLSDPTTATVEDEERRLSSRCSVVNKYETETSSEGFYIYMFREYSDELHPKSIYMKVDFNHAGFGRTCPMILPRYWQDDVDSLLDLTTNTESGLTYLKEGYPLKMVPSQLYIELRCVYDTVRNRYVYYLPKRYSSLVKDGKLTFNLFELKIKNEEDAPAATST